LGAPRQRDLSRSRRRQVRRSTGSDEQKSKPGATKTKPGATKPKPSATKSKADATKTK
jgi:hypothetical protein